MLRTNQTIGEGLICKVTEKNILESKKENMDRMESWEPKYTHVLTKSRQEYWEIRKITGKCSLDLNHGGHW